MKQNIWILNHYAGNMFFDKGGRHYSIAKYLKRNGYNPVVFCCNAKHGVKETYFDTDKLYKEELAEQIEVPFVFVRGRTYESNGLDRILNMIDFFFNVQRTAIKYAIKHKKPDIIYASSVHPLTLVAGILLSRLFRVKCICEVRDLWPESIVVYLTKFSKNNPLIKLFYIGEKWIYKMADSLIFTMEGAYDYILNQGWEDDIPKNKVHFVNNGVDFEQFNCNKDLYQIIDDDLENPNIFKVVYTGSIRKVNDVGKILDIAKQIKNQRIKFLIWGLGDDVELLKTRIIDEKIKNVVYKGHIEKKYIPYILSKGDLNFAHLKLSPLMKYGISFNKLFEYAASQKPILLDFHCSYNPAQKFGALVCDKNLDVNGVAEQIERIMALPKLEYEAYCENAYKMALEYDFVNLTKRLIEIIEDA